MEEKLPVTGINFKMTDEKDLSEGMIRQMKEISNVTHSRNYNIYIKIEAFRILRSVVTPGIELNVPSGSSVSNEAAYSAHPHSYWIIS